MKLLVLHGPNINKTGQRSKQHYGTDSFDSINREIMERAGSLGAECQIRQSNHEGDLVGWLQEAREEGFGGVALNAGAFTHYSYAIRDAIECAGVPVVEVHMSNVHAREEFRHTSVISPVCRGTILGLGKTSYFLAVQALVELLDEDSVQG